MSIDHVRMGTAMAVLTDRCLPETKLKNLADILQDHEEILAWLTLRQNAFDSRPNILNALATAASGAPSPRSSRIPSTANTRMTETYALQLENDLGLLIHENISRGHLAESADASLYNLNCQLEAQSFFDAQNRLPISYPIEACIDKMGNSDSITD